MSLSNSTSRRESIENRLQEALNPEALEVIDESHLHAGHEGAKSGGGHFRVTVVADCFTGLSTLARHRLVYDALGDAMGSEIHALGITALTPEEL